jgi:hypothetical protein
LGERALVAVARLAQFLLFSDENNYILLSYLYKC